VRIAAGCWLLARRTLPYVARGVQPAGLARTVAMLLL